MDKKCTVDGIAVHIAKLEADKRFLTCLLVILGIVECSTLVAFFIR